VRCHYIQKSLAVTATDTKNKRVTIYINKIVREIMNASKELDLE
jgi:hypothetical protein